MEIKRIERLKPKKKWLIAKRNRLKQEGHTFIREITKRVVGYCLQCKRIVLLKNVYEVQFKSMLKVWIGNCIICGTETYKKRG